MLGNLDDQRFVLNLSMKYRSKKEWYHCVLGERRQSELSSLSNHGGLAGSVQYFHFLLVEYILHKCFFFLNVLWNDSDFFHRWSCWTENLFEDILNFWPIQSTSNTCHQKLTKAMWCADQTHGVEQTFEVFKGLLPILHGFIDEVVRKPDSLPASKWSFIFFSLEACLCQIFVKSLLWKLCWSLGWGLGVQRPHSCGLGQGDKTLPGEHWLLMQILP